MSGKRNPPRGKSFERQDKKVTARKTIVYDSVLSLSSTSLGVICRSEWRLVHDAVDTVAYINFTLFDDVEINYSHCVLRSDILMP